MRIYEKMDRLEAVRRRAEIGICLIGIGIIVFFISMGIFQAEKGMYIGIILGVVGGFVFRGTHAAYQKIYKDLFVEEPLNKNFENVFYAWRSGFNLDEVNDFNICTKVDKVVSEDYVKADYKGIHFEMSDVKAISNMRHGKNDSGIRFQGRIIAFDFPDKAVKNTLVYTKPFFYRSKEYAAKQNIVKMESTAFNHDFDVYSDDAHDVFYLLTPHFMEQLDKLYKKYPKMCIRFTGNKVIVGLDEQAINNSFDKTAWTIKTTYPEEMAKVQNDIDDIKRIITMISGDNAEQQ